MLIDGRWIAPFTTEQEVAVGLTEVVPFLLDERPSSGSSPDSPCSFVSYQSHGAGRVEACPFRLATYENRDTNDHGRIADLLHVAAWSEYSAMLISETLRARTSNMASVTGVKVTDLTAAGASDDGEHVWITHRLGDGSEYPLVYPYEAVGYLITVLTDAARSASRRRIDQRPQEGAEGLNSNIVPVEEVRVGISPDNSAAIIHLTTVDKIPIAVEIPRAVLSEVVDQLRHAQERLEGRASGSKRLH